MLILTKLESEWLVRGFPVAMEVEIGYEPLSVVGYIDEDITIFHLY